MTLDAAETEELLGLLKDGTKWAGDSTDQERARTLALKMLYCSGWLQTILTSDGGDVVRAEIEAVIGSDS